MASLSWGQLIATIPIAGTQYNTYTTAQSMLTTATATEASSGFVTLPAGFFQRGSLLTIDFLGSRIESRDRPRYLHDSGYGGCSHCIHVRRITLTTTAHTNIPLRGHIELECRTVWQ